MWDYPKEACDLSMFGSIGEPVFVFGHKEKEDESSVVSSVYASGFVIPVLRHTADLLTILEWADRAVGDEESYGVDGTGRAPAGMSVAMVSVPVDESDTYNTFADSSFANAGCEGTAAQLAYKGWFVLIAGLWERFRKATPLHSKDGPFPYGLEARLYGDWQKIRNDVLKNNGVASKRNSARCEVLKWFVAGETIRFKLDHVLEFLHHMGHQLRSYGLMGRTRPLHYVGWRMAPASRFLNSRFPEARQPPWRVVSAILMVEEDTDNEGSYMLYVSLMFADAVVGVFPWERSTDRDKLVSLKQAVEQAPRDNLGFPEGIRVPVQLLHRWAKQALENGQLPMDTGAPPMQFGRTD